MIIEFANIRIMKREKLDRAGTPPSRGSTNSIPEMARTSSATATSSNSNNQFILKLYLIGTPVSTGIPLATAVAQALSKVPGAPPQGTPQHSAYISALSRQILQAQYASITSASHASGLSGPNFSSRMTRFSQGIL